MNYKEERPWGTFENLLDHQIIVRSKKLLSKKVVDQVINISQEK